MENFKSIDCVVVQGKRIASGLNNLPPSEKINDTIRKQKPYFARSVPGIENVLNGTINLSIAPHKFELVGYDHEITCPWEEGIEETFWLIRAYLEHAGNRNEGWIYYPCPGPLKKHNNGVFEFLAPPIEGLTYSERVVLNYPKDLVRII